MKILYVFLFIICAGASAADYNFINSNGEKTKIKPVVLNGKEYIAINRYYKSIFPGSAFDTKANTLNHKGSVIKITPSTFYLLCTAKGKTYSAQMSLPAIKPGADLLVPLESFFIALNQFPGYSAGLDEKVIVLQKFSHEKNNSNQSNTISETNGSGNEKSSAAVSNQLISGLKNHDSSETGEPFTADNNTDKNGNYSYDSKLFESFGHTSAGFLDKFEIINKIEKESENLSNETATSKIINLPATKESNKLEMSYPPNLYVIPKNLIRRELQEIKSKVNDN